MEKRKEYIDIAKGITIIMVILGHCLPNENLIKRYIYTFHMPLFFVLSGYFYKKNDIMPLIKKGVKSLIKPYLITSLSILTLKTLYATMKRKNVLLTIKQYCGAIMYGSGEITSFLGYNVLIIGAVWFLLSLFWVKLLYSVIQKIKKIQIRILLYWILSMIGFVLPRYIWLPLSIETALICVLFYLSGHFLREKNFFEEKNNKVGMFLLIIFWLISSYFTKTNCVSNIYNLYYFNIIVGVAGTIVIVEVSKLLSRIQSLKFILIWLGTNSLYILCIHTIEGRGIIPWSNYINYNNIFIKVLVRTAFPIIVTFVLKELQKLTNQKRIFTNRFIKKG